MKQLSGVDANFLYMETGTNYAHISGLFIYERPSSTFDPLAAVRAKYGHLVGELTPLRNRLVRDPFGLDHPYWIADPDFELDYHVRALNLPKPGRIDQLADEVARIVSRPLDRVHPLWEVYVIEGLEDGTWAVLSKMHHSAIDGAAGQLLLRAIHDTDPSPPPLPPPASWTPEPVPSEAALVSRAVVRLMINPFRAVRATNRVVRELSERTGGPRLPRFHLGFEREDESSSNRLPFPTSLAPPTPWNKSITRHRRIALAEASLQNIKRLRDATGATVNDIVMAICAGALREYLLAHEALPDQPLRALVPVSTRNRQEADPWTNRVSAVFVDLPTDCADALERVSRCNQAMLAAKRRHVMVPARALADLTQFSSPVLAAEASRLASQLRLADHVRPSVNVVVSNVPGTRRTLYLAGARLLKQFPISIVMDGQGLNITVQSYGDAIFFGFTADRQLVPDAWFLADLHLAEIERLFEATGAEWAIAPKGSLAPPGPTSEADASTQFDDD